MSAGTMELVIFGVSNMLSDIMDTARLRGYTIKAIVLNQPEVLRERTRGVHERISRIDPVPVVMDLDDFSPGSDEAYFLGTTAPARQRLVEQLQAEYGLQMMSLVHPAAFVSPLATLAEGVYVGPNSCIGAEAVLEPHVYVNRGVTVGHDTLIGAYTRLNPGSNIGGHVDIGRDCMVGMGAVVLEELVVGEGSIIAAGAVILRDVPEHVLMTGVPAKVKKQLDA